MADQPKYSVLTIERDEHVATVWLDRPEARNALGPDFWDEIPRAMAALADDAEIRAVVVAAKGSHFSVGLDLKAMAGLLSGGGAPSSGGDNAAPSMAAKAVAARAGV